MTHNGFTTLELIQISSRRKMDFGNLIQIDSRLKKLSEYFDSNQLTNQNTFQNFDTNQLMINTIWNIDSHDTMFEINC